jgi:hypothetical protein
VLGDGLHDGAASPEIVGYVSRHVRALNARPCGLFAVDPAPVGGVADPVPTVPVAATGALHGPATFRPRVTARFGTVLAPTRERWSHPPRVPRPRHLLRGVGHCGPSHGRTTRPPSNASLGDCSACWWRSGPLR